MIDKSLIRDMRIHLIFTNLLCFMIENLNCMSDCNNIDNKIIHR